MNQLFVLLRVFLSLLLFRFRAEEIATLFLQINQRIAVWRPHRGTRWHTFVSGFVSSLWAEWHRFFISAADRSGKELIVFAKNESFFIWVHGDCIAVRCRNFYHLVIGQRHL